MKQPSLINDEDPIVLSGPPGTGQQEYILKEQTKVVQKMHDSVKDWVLPDLPDLSRFDDVIMDLETNGLRWWAGDRLTGAALWTPDGVCRYLPVRHKVGPNIPEEAFFEWLRREFRGKKVTNIRTKFDLHMLRVENVDLEQQGCTFGDVAHYAALLDDHRRLFNQEDLARAYLPADPEVGKVKEALGFKLDPTKFQEYPAGLVAVRAENDVLTVARLRDKMWPLLTEQSLHRVRDLEEKIIPVVVEMEHNGALLDLELLNRWCKETEQILEDTIWEIYKISGVHMTSPDKRDEVLRLFSVLNILPPEDPTDKDKVSFADELLKPIKHRAIQLLRKAKQFKSLRSKFLLKYQKSVTGTGILRYELHQLPYEDDDNTGGAVSGRFSSAAPNREEGANIQQVMGKDKQQEEVTITEDHLHYLDVRPEDLGKKVKVGLTRDYLVKKLFIPDRRRSPNAQWVKADASQFQFRLFAHYANNPEIIGAYADDARKAAAGEKLTDFHQVVQDLVRRIKELSRTHTKNVNFAQVFGAGPRKMAEQLGVPANQIPAYTEPLDSGGPKFLEVLEVSAVYHKMFPEVKPLLGLTSHLAMPDHKDGERSCGRQCREFYEQGYVHRGFVRTFEGRRARFGPYDRHYSALNRVIQGTEGDYNKIVMIEMHNLRHELGILERFTVHDENDYDIADPGNLPAVKAALNTQYRQFKVSILWEVKMGINWAEAK